MAFLCNIVWWCLELWFKTRKERNLIVFPKSGLPGRTPGFLQTISFPGILECPSLKKFQKLSVPSASCQVNLGFSLFQYCISLNIYGFSACQCIQDFQRGHYCSYSCLNVCSPSPQTRWHIPGSHMHFPSIWVKAYFLSFGSDTYSLLIYLNLIFLNPKVSPAKTLGSENVYL